MTKYLMIATTILFTVSAQSASSADYFCSNTAKPPNLRVVTVQGEYATVQTDDSNLRYKVLEDMAGLLVLGKVEGTAERGSARKGYSVLVLDKEKMFMQAVNALTDKAHVEPRSTCMSRN